jgi:hypothetical protein
MSSLIAPGFPLEKVRKQTNSCSCGKEKRTQMLCASQSPRPDYITSIDPPLN